MITIDFTDKPEIYSIVYEALCATDRPFSGPEIRTISRVFNKLESIGRPTSNHLYHIAVDKPLVIFEDVEFELLVAAFIHVKWNALGARKAAGAYEFLFGLAQGNHGE